MQMLKITLEKNQVLLYNNCVSDNLKGDLNFNGIQLF